MSKRPDQEVSSSRRLKATARGRRLAAFLGALGLVVVVLFSRSPWKDAPTPGGAANAGTPVALFETQNEAFASPTEVAPLKLNASPDSDGSSAAKSGSPGASVSGELSATPVVPLTAIEVAAKIDAMVDAAPAHVAVDIALNDGTTLYQREPESLFDAASLYKLGIMVEVYRERDSGLLTFDDPVTLFPGYFYEEDSVYDPGVDVYAEFSVGDLLSSMITLSSNVAGQALLNLVGTDQVNATMASLGLTNTRILWSPVADVTGGSGTASTPRRLVHSTILASSTARFYHENTTFPAVSSAEGAYNVTTAGDMAQLFDELVAGTVVSPGTSAEMLALLSRQEINDRLPADLPPGTRVAHKTGDLDALLHDAGVIYAPKGQIVVVVMSDQVTDYDATIELMRRIALLAYEYER
ncbi:MAG TPA: serine hydrolase [Nitrolancea sp.]|nr:serine hydrolase [Nitrolancea sp.]